MTYMRAVVLHRFHQKAFTCARTEILKYIIKNQNDLQVHGSTPSISPEMSLCNTPLISPETCLLFLPLK